MQPATADGYAFAGFVSDSKLGQGATTSRGGFDGPTTSGTLTVFLDKGTLRATFHFAITANADGTDATRTPSCRKSDPVRGTVTRVGDLVTESADG